MKHFIAHNLRKRCIKKGFNGIHDRFQNDSTFRASLLSIDRTEEVCIQMDKDAQKDFTCHMSQDEYFRCKNNRWISLNAPGKNKPMKLRSDFNEALTKLHRLHRESGEERATRTDSFLAIPEMAPVIFFIQHILVAVERFLVMKISQKKSQAHLSS